MKQIQKISVGGEAQLETTEMLITNPDSGKFRLVFKHYKTFKRTITGEISANTSCNSLRSKLHEYTRKGSGLWIYTDCDKVCYDAAGAPTTSSKNYKSCKYTWKLKKHIAEKSYNGDI
jgi:ribosomal protein L37AE/L43A